jgi:hypothetical protein
MLLQENRTRAHRADEAISRYGDDISESNLIDLLTDAMHWCDAFGEDFARLLAHALHHYVTEAAGEVEQERSPL